MLSRTFVIVSEADAIDASDNDFVYAFSLGYPQAYGSSLCMMRSTFNLESMEN